MNFIFTGYFYPLKEKVTFLEGFGFAFDNARTPEEITEIEEMLKVAIPDGTSVLSRIGGMFCGAEGDKPDPFSLASTIAGIFQHLPQDDPYVWEFIQRCLNEHATPLNILARMWVVVTIEEAKIEEIKNKIHKQNPSAGSNTQMLEPTWYLEERLCELAHLAALLTCKYKNWDFRSFLAKSAPYGKKIT